MKLFPYLLARKISKIERFDNGLPTNFGPTVMMETTLKEAVKEAMNIVT